MDISLIFNVVHVVLSLVIIGGLFRMGAFSKREVVEEENSPFLALLQGALAAGLPLLAGYYAGKQGTQPQTQEPTAGPSMDDIVQPGDGRPCGECAKAKAIRLAAEALSGKSEPAQEPHGHVLESNGKA